MRPITDPTAGETARAIGMDPGTPLPISDPTDPRYGVSPLEARTPADQEPRVIDPTDPACGEPAG